MKVKPEFLELIDQEEFINPEKLDEYLDTKLRRYEKAFEYNSFSINDPKQGYMDCLRDIIKDVFED